MKIKTTSTKQTGKQNIMKDIEGKNKLTVTRGGREIMGERRERVIKEHV